MKTECAEVICTEFEGEMGEEKISRRTKAKSLLKPNPTQETVPVAERKIYQLPRVASQ